MRTRWLTEAGVTDWPDAVRARLGRYEARVERARGRHGDAQAERFADELWQAEYLVAGGRPQGAAPHWTLADAYERGVPAAARGAQPSAAEARLVLEQTLDEWRVTPYPALARLVEAVVDQTLIREVIAPSGLLYALEIQCWWDDRAGGDVRVAVEASGYDGGEGWTKRLAMDDVIRAPDGPSIGEEA